MQLSPILPKNQMTEEDIKLHYITPVLEAKWTKDRITMETRITDGKINFDGTSAEYSALLKEEKAETAGKAGEGYASVIQAGAEKHLEQ